MKTMTSSSSGLLKYQYRHTDHQHDIYNKPCITIANNQGFTVNCIYIYIHA